ASSSSSVHASRRTSRDPFEPEAAQDRDRRDQGRQRQPMRPALILVDRTVLRIDDALLEVLGRDVLEEFAELLQLLLFLFPVGGDQDGGLLEDILVGEDLAPETDRQRDRVRRARRDLEA